MGEIIRGKRRRFVYETVDNEVCIKRQRLNSEGDSNDSSDNDTKFGFPSTASGQAPHRSPGISFKSGGHIRKASGEFQTCELSNGKTSPRLRKQRPQPGSSVSQPFEVRMSPAGGEMQSVNGAASADATGQNGEEVDNREKNRRSPNGFLLPDPLPQGEVLRDTLGKVTAAWTVHIQCFSFMWRLISASECDCLIAWLIPS
jgi:hypothetical protein